MDATFAQLELPCCVPCARASCSFSGAACSHGRFGWFGLCSRVFVCRIRSLFVLCRVTGLRPRHGCDWMWVGMGKAAAGGVVWPHKHHVWDRSGQIGPSYECSSALDVRCAVCKTVIEPLFAISDSSRVHVRVRPCFWVFWIHQNTYISRGIGGWFVS